MLPLVMMAITSKSYYGDNKLLTFLQPMTRKRRYLSSVALNSRLYAIGGYDASSRLNTVECFDPSTAQWSVMTPMLQRRGLAGATALAGIMNPKSRGTNIIVKTGASITFVMIKIPYNVHSDWLKQCTLSESRCTVS